MRIEKVKIEKRGFLSIRVYTLSMYGVTGPVREILHFAIIITSCYCYHR